jgi:NDP-sugar pyrophosphorylase family protein
VLNGDVVTTLDYRYLLRSHRASGNVLTIATRKRETKMDYGVLSLEPRDGPLRRLVGYQEKPVVETMVSMGIYALEPQALEFIPEGRYFDFPDLVQALLHAGAPVGSFVFDGLWLDVGRHDDYEQAVALWESGALGPLVNGKAGGNGHAAESSSRPRRRPGRLRRRQHCQLFRQRGRPGGGRCSFDGARCVAADARQPCL